MSRIASWNSAVRERPILPMLAVIAIWSDLVGLTAAVAAFKGEWVSFAVMLGVLASWFVLAMQVIVDTRRRRTRLTPLNEFLLLDYEKLLDRRGREESDAMVARSLAYQSPDPWAMEFLDALRLVGKATVDGFSAPRRDGSPLSELHDI